MQLFRLETKQERLSMLMWQTEEVILLFKFAFCLEQKPPFFIAFVFIAFNIYRFHYKKESLFETYNN